MLNPPVTLLSDLVPCDVLKTSPYLLKGSRQTVTQEQKICFYLICPSSEHFEDANEPKSCNFRCDMVLHVNASVFLLLC